MRRKTRTRWRRERRLGRWLGVAACVGACAGAVGLSASPAGAGADPFAPMDRALGARVARDGLPGGVLYVGAGGSTVHVFSARKVGPATVLPIASASKWLTSALVMTLVDEGRLTLDGRVGDLLPGFDGAKRSVTVRQLLSHTSGLASDPCVGSPDTTTAACVGRLAAGPDPVSAPGMRFAYSGVGYEVAGRIVEVLTGQSFGAAFAARIAGPLGLEHTAFDRLDGATVAHPVPSASATSTVDDYAKFLAMLAAGGVARSGPADGQRILSADSVAEIERDQVRGLDTSGDGAVAITGIPTYGLGVWRDEVGPADEARIVSGNGAFGFYPWIDRRAGSGGTYGIVAVADLTHGPEYAVPRSQKLARSAWQAAARR
ncbi:MAG: serine hydrolase domain-containing protein [Actinomycetes bacterium]